MPSFTFTFDEPVEKPKLWQNPKKIAFEGEMKIQHFQISNADSILDYLELTALMFDWGDSYDAKVLLFP